MTHATESDNRNNEIVKGLVNGLHDCLQDKLDELGQENDELKKQVIQLEKALDYYRTAAAQMPRYNPKPNFVPKKIEIFLPIRSEESMYETLIQPGEYEAHCNKYGAVSVRGQKGKLIGVKLHEFAVLEWQENTKAE